MIETELLNEIEGRMRVLNDLLNNLYQNLNELGGTLENIQYLKYLLEKIKYKQ